MSGSRGGRRGSYSGFPAGSYHGPRWPNQPHQSDMTRGSYYDSQAEPVPHESRGGGVWANDSVWQDQGYAWGQQHQRNSAWPQQFRHTQPRNGADAYVDHQFQVRFQGGSSRFGPGTAGTPHFAERSLNHLNQAPPDQFATGSSSRPHERRPGSSSGGGYSKNDQFGVNSSQAGHFNKHKEPPLPPKPPSPPPLGTSGTFQQPNTDLANKVKASLKAFHANKEQTPGGSSPSPSLPNLPSANIPLPPRTRESRISGSESSSPSRSTSDTVQRVAAGISAQRRNSQNRSGSPRGGGTSNSLESQTSASSSSRAVQKQTEKAVPSASSKAPSAGASSTDQESSANKEQVMTITKDVMNRYIKSMDNQQLRQLVDQPRDRISQFVINHLVSETQTARARQLSALRFGTSPSDSTFSEQSFVLDPSLSVDGEVYLSDALMDNVMQLLMQEKENPSCEASPSTPLEDDDIEVLPPPPPKTPPPVIDLDLDDAPPPEITKPQTKKEDASKPGPSQEKLILIPGIRPITASSTLPSQTTAGPKPTAATPNSTATSSKSTSVTPKSTTGAPKSTGTVPKSTGPAPGSTGSKHTSTDVAPKSSASGSKSTAVAPTPTVVIAQSTGVAQNVSVSAPKSTGAASGPTVATSHSTGVPQNPSSAALQSHRTTPAPTTVASGTIGVVPGSNVGTQIPPGNAPNSTAASGSTASTPNATVAGAKSTGVVVMKQVDMEVQTVLSNSQLNFVLSDYALEERQANERIAVIDKRVEEYLKERMELASRVQTLKQLQFDALRSALPVTSTAGQIAPIRPSFAITESQLQFDTLRSALPVTSTADQIAPIRPSLAITESQQVPTPSHVQESGGLAGNAQSVHLRTTVVLSTETPPSGAQPISTGTSSHTTPSVQVQQVTVLSTESPPAHKRKRSDTGQSDPPRKKSNDNTHDKNKDRVSEVAAKLSNVSTGNTTPPSHPPKKSSEATLPTAKKIATNTSKTQNAAVIDGWNRVDAAMEVDPPSSSLRKEVGHTNQTAQTRVSKPSSSSSSSSKSKSSSSTRKHSSSSSTSTSSKKTSSKDTNNSASPVPSAATPSVSKENNTPATPTLIASSLPKGSSNTVPSTATSSAPPVSKGLSTQATPTPTSVAAAPVSKETSTPTSTSTVVPVPRVPSNPAPPVSKGPGAPATSTPTSVATPVQRVSSTLAPPVSKGPSTQVPSTTTPPVTKNLDSAASVSSNSAQKSSAAHPTSNVPLQSASSNKNSKIPPVEPPNAPNAAALPLSNNLNAKPLKAAPAPQSAPPRQSSSLSDKSINPKAPSKSSTVAPSPSNDAARNSLPSTASSGNITTVNQQGTSPLRSATNSVSNPPSSMSSLAEPSVASKSYDLQQLPAHTSSVRCLFINGPCLFSASDDGIVHVYNLVSGEIVYRVRGHTDPVTWLFAVSLNADASVLKAISENTLEYINQLHLITGSSDGFIRRFELRTADSEPQPNELCCGIPVTCVAGSRDQGRLYVGSRDGVIFIYNPKTNTIIKAKFKSDSEILCLKVNKFRSHKRAIIVAARRKDPVIFDLDTGALLFTMKTNMPVGSSIYSITSNNSMVYCSDVTEKIFSFDTDSDNALFQVDTLPSSAVNLYHAKKRYILMGCMDGVVRVMDTLRKPPTVTKDLPGGHMKTLTAMKYSGDKIVSGGFGGEVSCRIVPELSSLFD